MSNEIGFHARWDEVQSSFVDDPRAAVARANALVKEAADQLVTAFESRRSLLEEQWSRGEEVSTEELRVTLQRYRQFFESLQGVRSVVSSEAQQLAPDTVPEEPRSIPDSMEGGQVQRNTQP